MLNLLFNQRKTSLSGTNAARESVAVCEESGTEEIELLLICLLSVCLLPVCLLTVLELVPLFFLSADFEPVSHTSASAPLSDIVSAVDRLLLPVGVLCVTYPIPAVQLKTKVPFFLLRSPVKTEPPANKILIKRISV